MQLNNSQQRSKGGTQTVISGGKNSLQGMVSGFQTQEMKKNGVAQNQSSLGLSAAMNQIRPRGSSHQSKLRSGGKIHLLGNMPSNQRNFYSNFQMSNNSTQGGKANSSSRRNKRATTTAGTSMNVALKDSHEQYQIQVAELAINEMRNNLNQNKKEYRPKSQNDVGTNNTAPDETAVDEEIDKEQFLEII